MIRTDQPATTLSAPAAVRAYKQLKVAEHAFRRLKSPELQIRPIYHHLEDRVRAHALLCMLAYYVQFELSDRLAPLLYPTTPRPPTPTPSSRLNHHPPRRPRPAPTTAATATDCTPSPTCSPNSAR